MSEKNQSIELKEFLEDLTQGLSDNIAVEEIVQAFKINIHRIIIDDKTYDTYGASLYKFAHAMMEKSGDKTADYVSEINALAKEHQVLIEIAYRETSENTSIETLRTRLIEAGVFEILESYADGGVEYIDIDDESLVVEYLTYLEYQIIDIPSLYRYLRTCISLSQNANHPDDINLFEEYIIHSAQNTDESSLSHIYETYDYLDTTGSLYQTYKDDFLEEGLSLEEAEVESEMYQKEYAWIHMMMLSFYENIILPRITTKKLEGDLENLSDKEVDRVYGILNDWIDILDPERFIPERFPMKHSESMYENIDGENIRILH